MRRIVLFIIWSRQRWKRLSTVAGCIRRIEITSEKLAITCGELASNKKAEDIVILDLREISTFTDFFVLCSATSEPHLKAIAGEIEARLKEDYKISAAAVDGFPASQWIVLDYLQVVVHVFHRDKREFYSLEDLWGDAPRIELESNASVSGRH
ncbi:MAG TPA: ribosome silencing factor [Chthoniobacterales bacterium]